MFNYLPRLTLIHTRFIHAVRNFQRTPISKFIELPDRPLVLENGLITRGPLQVHYWEWAGSKPTVIFCHAASFHGRCYDHIIKQAFPESHVISVELRGHGRSHKHPPPYSFRWFGGDMAALIQILDLEKIIGVGHSVGGYALVLSSSILGEINQKSIFDSLFLLDPVIFSPEVYACHKSEEYRKMCESFEIFRRRKSKWFSVQHMVEYLYQKEPFRRWPTSILLNYCAYALDKDYHLLCSPSTEVSIYSSMVHNATNIYDEIERSNSFTDVPVYVIRCSTPFTKEIKMVASFTAPTLAKHFLNGHDLVLENTTHLFPMEKPNLVVDVLKNLINIEECTHQVTDKRAL